MRTLTHACSKPHATWAAMACCAWPGLRVEGEGRWAVRAPSVVFLAMNIDAARGIAQSVCGVPDDLTPACLPELTPQAVRTLT